MKTRKKSPQRPNAKCSSCGRKAIVQRGDWHKAARLRCMNCGGPLNRFREA